jgi:uncharacterized sulfatase
MQNTIIGNSGNLDRAFDRSSKVGKSELIAERRIGIILKYLRNYRKHTTGYTEDGIRFSGSFISNQITKQWLREMQDEQPFFLYLHYGDSHHPYAPPKPYLDMYTDEIAMGTRDALRRSLKINERQPEIITDCCDLSQKDWDALQAMYDATMRYTDDQLGLLLDYVETLDLGSTIVVVTADHGDLFGEQGMMSHRLVIDDGLTHVPMVVDGLEALACTAQDIIQPLDVMQTMLDDIGANTSQFQGINLRQETREFAISERSKENFGMQMKLLLEADPCFDVTRFPPSFLTALRTDDFKYQKSAKRNSLYELPDEENDVINQYAEVATELDEKLESWRSVIGEGPRADKRSELSASERKQLEHLGYL